MQLKDDALVKSIDSHNSSKRSKVSASMARDMRVSNANREQNPIEPNRADILPWFLYDRLKQTTASVTLSEYDFFTTPIGGTKTKQDTNLEQTSRLSDPQHFNTLGLRMYFSSIMLLADVVTILDNYYIEFWIGQKVYAEGPLSQFPAGAGIYGFAGTGDLAGAYTNGLPSPQATVDFRIGDSNIGHHILQGQTFKVKLLTNTTFTLVGTFNVLCTLEGILSRGVQ